jgi:hypothetical protein
LPLLTAKTLKDEDFIPFDAIFFKVVAWFPLTTISPLIYPYFS